eukprot:14927475-Ditylum_brightwellii.AAC.1
MDCIIKCWQNDGSCTGSEGALNVPLKILFGIGMVELLTVDYQRADSLFAEYLLATEQTTMPLAMRCGWEGGHCEQEVCCGYS